MAVLISVLLPAYRAQDHIRQTVGSIYESGLPPEQLEILVESDDGYDYPEIANLPSVKIATSGQIASGVGATRNRALARVTGRYVTYIDADDLWGKDFLISLLPLMGQSPIAAAPLQVSEADEVILSLWQGQDRLGFADMSASGASVRGLFAHEAFMPFENSPAQDIYHSVKAMEASAGQMPLSKVPYILRSHPQSVTKADDFSAKVHQAYLGYIQMLKDPESIGVFAAKIELNEAFIREGVGQSYYRFIAGLRS